MGICAHDSYSRELLLVQRKDERLEQRFIPLQKDHQYGSDSALQLNKKGMER